jgi:hypothetical protein
MGLFGLGPKKSIDTRKIENEQHRAAAELIDERVGKQDDHQITDKDLKAAEKLLVKHQRANAAGKPHESPFRVLDPSLTAGINTVSEADLLAQNLPALSDYLKDPKETFSGPFATVIRTDAVREQSLRNTAAFIAEIFGQGADEINLKELGLARKAFNALEAKQLNTSDPQLAEKIAASEQSKSFTGENLAKLEQFMLHGKGGLCDHGPVSINGQVFEDVFLLPFTNAETVTDNASLKAIIDEYELRFQKTGYDRIYIHDEGKVFVALHKSGRLNRVDPGFRVQMSADGDYKDSGVVARVVDVSNSYKEATFGFWRDVVGNVVGGIRGKLHANLEKELDVASTAAVSKPEGGKSKPEMKDLMVGAGVAASLGAAMFNIPAAVMVISGTGGLVTAMNVIDYVATGHDKAPFYHAIGVAVNRNESVKY